MTEGSIPRRYAKALFELAQEAGSIEGVGKQLDALVELAQANDGQVLAVMSNPGFTASERRAVLELLLPRLGLSGLMLNFVRLVLDKDRFLALPDMAREYRALADDAANRVRATVTTATAASPALRAEITRSLSASTGKDVVVEMKVDPTLLGGMVARVGSKLYDASLRTRLDDLQVTLATTALS